MIEIKKTIWSVHDLVGFEQVQSQFYHFIAGGGGVIIS